MVVRFSVGNGIIARTFWGQMGNLIPFFQCGRGRDPRWRTPTTHLYKVETVHELWCCTPKMTFSPRTQFHFHLHDPKPHAPPTPPSRGNPPNPAAILPTVLPATFAPSTSGSRARSPSRRRRRCRSPRPRPSPSLPAAPRAASPRSAPRSRRAGGPARPRRRAR